MAGPDLYWHCAACGTYEPVEPTGGDDEYAVGDMERCIDCGDGTAHVVEGTPEGPLTPPPATPAAL